MDSGVNVPSAADASAPSYSSQDDGMGKNRQPDTHASAGVGIGDRDRGVMSESMS